jgi:hypothetical protein
LHFDFFVVLDLNLQYDQQIVTFRASFTELIVVIQKQPRILSAKHQRELLSRLMAELSLRQLPELHF